MLLHVHGHYHFDQLDDYDVVLVTTTKATSSSAVVSPGGDGQYTHFFADVLFSAVDSADLKGGKLCQTCQLVTTIRVLLQIFLALIVHLKQI